MSEDCIFCKIVKNEVPTDYVYEDDKCVVFNDINPKNNTHLLIVPKEHIVSIAEMSDAQSEVLLDLFRVARDIAAKSGLKGYNLQINVGKEGGQEIPHLHIHLLSKYSS